MVIFLFVCMSISFDKMQMHVASQKISLNFLVDLDVRPYHNIKVQGLTLTENFKTTNNRKVPNMQQITQMA